MLQATPHATPEPVPLQGLHWTRVITATEHIRPMRGGSQPHLMRCSDGHFYVVKFLNNPQGSRIVVNEYIAGKLAELLGLPCPETCLVDVKKELVNLTPGLVIELQNSKIPVASGFAFGSEYPSYQNGHGRKLETIYDFYHGGIAGQTENLSDFLGVLVFDKWTCNTDHREVVFLPQLTKMGIHFRMMMIDNGFCFNGVNWNFPNSTILGLYHDRTVYRNVNGIGSFEVWLKRLELKVTCQELMTVIDGIPAQWLAGETKILAELLECLFKRKKIVPDLLRQALGGWHG